MQVLQVVTPARWVLQGAVLLLGDARPRHCEGGLVRPVVALRVGVVLVAGVHLDDVVEGGAPAAHVGQVGPGELEECRLLRAVGALLLFTSGLL